MILVFSLFWCGWEISSNSLREYMKGDNILAKYFANWYDAVPMLDIIGHNGRLLIVPISDISFYLVIP